MSGLLALWSNTDEESVKKQEVARASFMCIVVRPSILLIFLLTCINRFDNYTGNFSYTESPIQPSLCYVPEETYACIALAIREEYTMVKSENDCQLYAVEGSDASIPLPDRRFEEVSNETGTAIFFMWIQYAAMVIQAFYVVVLPLMIFFGFDTFFSVEEMYAKISRNISAVYAYQLLFVMCFLPRQYYTCYMLPDLSFNLSFDISPNGLRNVIAFSAMSLASSTLAGYLSQQPWIAAYPAARDILWKSFLISINFIVPFFLFPVTMLFSSAYSNLNGDGSSGGMEGLFIVGIMSEFQLMAVPSKIPKDDRHFWYRRWVLLQDPPLDEDQPLLSASVNP
eukprot:TRINITY_DN15759_c0_g1_i1.p1 TRINITY_DN15759_c0_g1~~TRINITY_DN15759_c0_g1_i1.p1  ORF type:complete len:339 (+),score=77.10 TRINITY_DN15759_c0_g1_i1:52-1068(+)